MMPNTQSEVIISALCKKCRKEVEINVGGRVEPHSCIPDMRGDHPIGPLIYSELDKGDWKIPKISEVKEAYNPEIKDIKPMSYTSAFAAREYMKSIPISKGRKFTKADQAALDFLMNREVDHLTKRYRGKGRPRKSDYIRLKVCEIMDYEYQQLMNEMLYGPIFS